LDTSAIPAAFLHNCIAVVLVLLFSTFIRIRWLVSLIAWALTIGVSFFWRDIGCDWYSAWQTYLHEPVFGKGLWTDSASEVEIIGLLIFWLMPLALAYATALARITKISD
jgi:hypothetical protein